MWTMDRLLTVRVSLEALERAIPGPPSVIDTSRPSRC